MTSLTRYTCYYRDPFGDSGPALSEKDSDGDWVRYEDAQAEIERLRGLLAGVVSQFRKTGCTCSFPDSECCAYAAAKAEVDRS